MTTRDTGRGAPAWIAPGCIGRRGGLRLHRAFVLPSVGGRRSRPVPAVRQPDLARSGGLARVHGAALTGRRLNRSRAPADPR